MPSECDESARRDGGARRASAMTRRHNFGFAGAAVCAEPAGAAWLAARARTLLMLLAAISQQQESKLSRFGLDLSARCC
eukprot:COSAG01_NODE_4279_length_5181_cov_556.950433_9_plen_79_part_00